MHLFMDLNPNKRENILTCRVTDMKILNKNLRSNTQLSHKYFYEPRITNTFTFYFQYISGNILFGQNLFG